MLKNLLMGLSGILLGLLLTSCLSLPQSSSSDEMPNDEIANADSAPETDDFAELESTPEAAPTTAESTTTTTTADEFDLEAQPAAEVVAQNEKPAGGEFDDLNLEETLAAESNETKTIEPAPVVTTEPEPEVPVMTQTAPEPVSQPIPTTTAEPIPSQGRPIEITSVQFKANESGGTLLVQATGPIEFNTRRNSESNQIVVEIANAKLPDRLKRPLNMKDMSGSMGAVDAYQTKGSTTARFVIQMRPNTQPPFITAEGDTLLVVADKTQGATAENEGKGSQKGSNEYATNADPANMDEASEKILSSRNLQEFLAGNTKFYGKKISLETNNMQIREALRYISDQAGVNMIIAENVAGNVSLKLREVPWDQAFVVIMKTKDLGYVRQGNVLRVATLADLKREEKDLFDQTLARLSTEPLKVNVYSVNYAKVEDLSARIKDFLTSRGKVAGDSRTNSIIVTDIEQNLEKITQLVQNLDIQPPQVLIEGRVVEASDSFQRQVGINWSFGGNDVSIGNSITLRPGMNIITGNQTASNLSLQMGTFDVLGDINAVLSMNEVEGKVRILSSPRIVTLSNERAMINQKTSIAIPKVIPASGNNPASTGFEFKDLELKLEVTPQVTSNASVIMNILVKRDLLNPEQINGQSQIESREASAKVMVKNGQTSIIGGVYQNDAQESISGVPWFKDIPVLGSLFRFKDNRTRRTELMIFLTPRIVAAGSEALENSTKQLSQTGGASEN